MKLLVINNGGVSTAEYVEVADGTTVENLFAQQVPHGKPKDYAIYLNRKPVAANTVMQDKDCLSFCPLHI
jgi:sulfur carrier protein ThiS